MPTKATSQPDFATHFEKTFLRLRGALTELVLAAGGDPTKPQELSRRFGLDKTLSWKVSRLMTGRQAIPSVRHLPGSSGMEIVLGKLAEAGVAPKYVTAAREARDHFDQMVAVQAGDRATLEVMLGSMAPERADSPRLENARKQSFKGNSSIWGVQARLRWGVQLVSPNAEDANRVDLAVMSGYLDLRRLRPTAWPLVHTRNYGDAVSTSGDEPLDPRAEGQVALLRDFCSEPLPDVQVVPEPDGVLYELAEGPIGNTQSVDCALGWLHRNFAPATAGPDADEDDPVIEHSLVLDTPVEEVHFDVFFHRALPFEQVPRAALYSLMEGRPHFPLSKQPRYLLHPPLEVQRLGSAPPVVTTPGLPRYAEMLEFACGRMGVSLEDFVGYRIRLRYPPIPTLPFLYHPMPAR